jgi:dCTP deaminase
VPELRRIHGMQLTAAARMRGALPDVAISALFSGGAVARDGGFDQSLVQPASLDLSLSAEGWRLPASVLPLRTESIADLIAAFARRRLDLSTPQTLDRGKVYVVRLQERLRLPPGIGAYTNNKSSIGRLDLQTRTLADRNPRFDKIPRGYEGGLWLEITPRSFDVTLAAGASLNQAIFYGRRDVLGTAELEALLLEEPLLFDSSGCPLPPESVWLDDGVLLTVDLDQDPVGFMARATTEEVSLLPGARNPASEFFEPLPKPRDGRLFLRRGHFYILSTREFVRIPPGYAVEMLPYETSAGEFRAHYAGFFDPGFGWSPAGQGRGTPAVLELRPYDDDLILRHRQPICKMAFERMSGAPVRPYGEADLPGHYQDQRGPRLSRYFQGRQA